MTTPQIQSNSKLKVLTSTSEPESTTTGTPPAKNGTGSSTTLAATKPAKPLVRGPIGSEPQKHVKGLVDGVSGALKPSTVNITSGGPHTESTNPTSGRESTPAGAAA